MRALARHHTHGQVMSRVTHMHVTKMHRVTRMHHVTRMNESWHMYARVITRIEMHQLCVYMKKQGEKKRDKKEEQKECVRARKRGSECAREQESAAVNENERVCLIERARLKEIEGNNKSETAIHIYGY